MEMEIGEVVQRSPSSFVVLDASWPPDQGRRLISDLSPTHIVIRAGKPPELRYFLFETGEVLSRLETGQPDIEHALDLKETLTVPLVAATEAARRAPARCIVHDDGIIVGIFDAGSRQTDMQLGPARLPPFPYRRGTEATAVSEPSLVARELLTDFPKEVELGVLTSLIASITTPTTTVSGLLIALPIGAMVDIVVQPRRGFEIEGRAEASLEIEEQETRPVQFKVRGTAIGVGELRVLAFHQGQSLGVTTLSVVVVPAGTGPKSTERVERSRPLAAVSVRPQPDIMLLIEERYGDHKPGFFVRLSAPYLKKPHNLTPFGPIPLQTDAVQYFEEFFEDIEKLPLDTDEERAIAAEQLRAKGAGLFERLFPSDLKRIIWDLRDHGLSLVVQSEEPWIPWELCRLCIEVDGVTEDGPFLCEAFAMTRWQPGTAFKTPLRMTNMALVVPGDSELPFASVERNAVLALARDGRKVTPITANFLEVQRALASGEYDAWHFTGHGAHPTSDPNKAEIQLEKMQIFTPDNLSGKVRNLGRAHPLVFLNACQTGRGGMSLTGIGGWAREFLKAGAGAFIGTYWSVFDRTTCDFAQAFYASLLGGEPIGKAVQSARAAIRNSGNPSWLAYTVFADPLATLSLTPPPP